MREQSSRLRAPTTALIAAVFSIGSICSAAPRQAPEVSSRTERLEELRALIERNDTGALDVLTGTLTRQTDAVFFLDEVSPLHG